MSWDGQTLPEYVESLLRLGKRSQSEEFQTLMMLYGKEKITAIAKEILAKEKSCQNEEDRE